MRVYVCLYLRAKHLRTRVNLVDVHQNPRPDFVSIKGCFVFAESDREVNLPYVHPNTDSSYVIRSMAPSL